MARLNLSFTHDGSIDITHPRTGWEAVKRIARYLWGIGNGANTNSSVVAQDGVTAASGTLTLASVLAGTIVRVNNVPFTAVNSGATGDQFNVGGTNAEDATSLAAAITASATAGVSGVVTASASDNVVTVTAQDSGLHGNAVTLSVDAVAATGTLTLSTVTAGTVVRVNGVPFTAVNGSPVVANGEFDMSGSNDADATSLAAAINGSSNAAITGVVTASANTNVVTVTAVTAGKGGNTVTLETDGVVASGTVTYSSATGTLTTTINGVNVTASAGVDDTASAVAMAAALNASVDALVAGHVRATSDGAEVQIYAIKPGEEGNAITLAAAATGGSATASGARLAGGVVTEGEGTRASGSVTISGADGGAYSVTINGVASNATGVLGDDGATADAIAAAIQQQVGSGLVRWHVSAESDGIGVVSVTSQRGGIGGNAITLAASGTGATASGVRLTGGAVATTVVLSGARLSGGAANSTVTLSGARLTGGAVTTEKTYAL